MLLLETAMLKSFFISNFAYGSFGSYRCFIKFVKHTKKKKKWWWGDSGDLRVRMSEGFVSLSSLL